jgi:hypothetical protein
LEEKVIAMQELHDSSSEKCKKTFEKQKNDQAKELEASEKKKEDA